MVSNEKKDKLLRRSTWSALQWQLKYKICMGLWWNNLVFDSNPEWPPPFYEIKIGELMTNQWFWNKHWSNGPPSNTILSYQLSKKSMMDGMTPPKLKTMKPSKLIPLMYTIIIKMKHSSENELQSITKRTKRQSLKLEIWFVKKIINVYLLFGKSFMIMFDIRAGWMDRNLNQYIGSIVEYQSNEPTKESTHEHNDNKTFIS